MEDVTIKKETIREVFTENIKTGDLLESKAEEWYLVLKVEDSGFIQNGFNGKWGTQSMNNEQSIRITVYDGYKFTSTYSLEEISKMFIKIKRIKLIEFEEEEFI